MDWHSLIQFRRISRTRRHAIFSGFIPEIVVPEPATFQGWRNLPSGPSTGGKAPVRVRDKRRWSWLITVLKIGLSVLAFGSRGVFCRSVGGMGTRGQPIDSLCRAVGFHPFGAAPAWWPALARNSRQAWRKSVAAGVGSALLHIRFLQCVSLGSSRRRCAASLVDLSPPAQREDRDQFGRAGSHRSNRGVALLVLATAPIFFARVGNTLADVYPVRSRLRGAGRHRRGRKSSPDACCVASVTNWRDSCSRSAARSSRFFSRRRLRCRC